MKTVITYGTFDLFHYGHYNLIKRASDLGDRLIVGCSTDAMCEAKGKVPFFSQEKRVEILKSFRFVDEVILENNMEQKVEDAKKYRVDMFVIGDDYKDIFPKMKEYQQLIDMGVEVVFLPRTPEISTSQLKEKLKKEHELNESRETIHNMTNKD